MDWNVTFLLKTLSQKPGIKQIQVNKMWCVSSAGSVTYVRGGEKAFGAALVGLSEPPELSQTQGLTVQGAAASLTHAQRAVAVLHAPLIVPLRDRDR